MTTHSSILAWRILCSWGLKEKDMTERLSTEQGQGRYSRCQNFHFFPLLLSLPLPPLPSEKGPPSLHPSPGSSVTLGPKAFWPLTHSIPGDVTSGVSCRGSLVAPPHIPGPVPVLVVPEVTA